MSRVSVQVIQSVADELLRFKLTDGRSVRRWTMSPMVFEFDKGVAAQCMSEDIDVGLMVLRHGVVAGVAGAWRKFGRR